MKNSQRDDYPIGKVHDMLQIVKEICVFQIKLETYFHECRKVINNMTSVPELEKILESNEKFDKEKFENFVGLINKKQFLRKYLIKMDLEDFYNFLIIIRDIEDLIQKNELKKNSKIIQNLFDSFVIDPEEFVSIFIKWKKNIFLKEKVEKDKEYQKELNQHKGNRFLN